MEINKIEVKPSKVAKSHLHAINRSVYDYKKVLSHIVEAYDSFVIRAYAKARFTIININILQILGLLLRDRKRVLDIGSGFGLFGCYFSSMDRDISYTGFDLNANRVEKARKAALSLGLDNAVFLNGDARDLKITDEYDAIFMVDLLHHIDDEAKARLLDQCIEHLAPGGRLIIKDVARHPFHKIAFTWALDVLMTRSFDMWYWSEDRFYTTLSKRFDRVEMYPLTDWLPYPHVIYLCENRIGTERPPKKNFKAKRKLAANATL
ncbi:MAG TPA: class I SAM-dependent methyltransferase [Pyrinomonadaceae bacterium]|nr:class I SAM-dependent methyltransferase [Pyrinomonadaceae bacterium]